MLIIVTYLSDQAEENDYRKPARSGAVDQAEGKGKEEGRSLRRRKLGMYSRARLELRGEREEKRSGCRRARRRGVGVIAPARLVAISVAASVAASGATLVTIRLVVVGITVAAFVTAVIIVVAGLSVVVLVAIFVAFPVAVLIAVPVACAKACELEEWISTLTANSFRCNRRRTPTSGWTGSRARRSTASAPWSERASKPPR